jgi:4-hydroxy-2-oxoheptanedioate aldolase
MTMNLAKNKFRRALRQGDQQLGLWCTLASPIAAEIASDSGFDWLLLDMEHSPNEVTDVLRLLQAAQGGPSSCVVRVAWNDPVLIKRVLDIGAQSILIPYVQNAAEAEKAVAATRYPPDGIRGVTGSGRASRYGRVKNYLQTANEEVGVYVQIETREALSEIEAVAAVPGVDGIFIGPSDLSASFGLIGQPQAPDIQKVIQDAGGRITAAGKAAGILASSIEDARRYLSWSYRFVAAGVDTVLLTRAIDDLAKQVKG